MATVSRNVTMPGSKMVSSLSKEKNEEMKVKSETRVGKHSQTPVELESSGMKEKYRSLLEWLTVSHGL
ncbi:hypothetical protein Tco_0410322 [Tanacetum coccineum]